MICLCSGIFAVWGGKIFRIGFKVLTNFELLAKLHDGNRVLIGAVESVSRPMGDQRIPCWVPPFAH